MTTSGGRARQALPDVLFAIVLAFSLATPLLHHVHSTTYATSGSSGGASGSGSSGGSSGSGDSSGSGGSGTSGSSGDSRGSSGTSGGSGGTTGGDPGTDTDTGNDADTGESGGDTDGAGSTSGSAGTSGGSGSGDTVDQEGDANTAARPLGPSLANTKAPTNAELIALVGTAIITTALVLTGVYGFVFFCLIGYFGGDELLPDHPANLPNDIAKACRSVEVRAPEGVDVSNIQIKPETPLGIEVLDPPRGKKRPTIVVTPMPEQASQVEQVDNDFLKTLLAIAGLMIAALLITLVLILRRRESR